MYCIPEHQLEALMSIFSKRDLPEKSRTAIRMVVLNGFSFARAARLVGMTPQSVSLAVKKIDKADTLMREIYLV